jgi:hypothetical protein
MAPKRSASCIVACSRSAPVRSASPRLAPVRSANRNCAPLTSARYRIACLSRALLRFAPRRSASVRSAHSRSAPRRSASFKWTMRSSAFRRFAPLKSGWIFGPAILILFHTSAPCSSNPTCSSSATPFLSLANLGQCTGSYLTRSDLKINTSVIRMQLERSRQKSLHATIVV